MLQTWSRPTLRGSQAPVTQHPLVSIVTPSLNQGRFIRDAIESVFRQSYPRVELIVVDAVSRDETPEILAEYADRLTAVVEPDHGQSHAINKGFRRARGEIVSWLNCDDMLLPEAVQNVVETFARDGALGIVYGDGYLIDTKAGARCLFKAGPMNIWKLVHVSQFLLQPAAFFRRNVLDEIGYVDESLHWAMDWDLMIRAAKRFRTAYIPLPLAEQRVYDTTKTATGGRRRFRELVRIMRAHGEYRYPPAYFLYGADTYEMMLMRALERWMPQIASSATTRLRAIVRNVAERVKLGALSDGWYWDRWVTTRARFQFHREGRALALCGTLPEVFPVLRGQAIDALVDGRVAVRQSLEFGKFRILIPVEPGPRLVDVELRSPKFFVPRRRGLNEDRRKLCYLLDSIEWIP